MTIILTLAYNVFRRLRRKKAFWILMSIFFMFTAAGLIAAIFWKESVVGEDVLGFVGGNVSTAPVLCMLLAIVVAQDSVSYEINKSSIHLILARPITPEKCMGGLYAGSVISVLVPYLGLSLMSFVGIAAVTTSYLSETLAAMILFTLPLVLLAVVVTFFSSWMPGAFAGMAGFALFIFSFFSQSMDSWAGRVNLAYRIPLRFLNLFSLRLDSFFNLVTDVVNGQGMAWRPLVWVAGYTFIVLALGILLFRFRKV